MKIFGPVIPGGKKGSVGKISVKLGDFVKKDDVLAQVETAKGNKTVKATQSGIINEILINEGDEISSKESMFNLIEKEEKETSKDTILIQEETNNLEKEINQINTDLLIIGSGPGGYVAAIYAAKKGLDVTIVEKNNLGGTCLNVGCIPTKALVKSSEICHNVKNSSIFGINTSGPIQVDMEKVISRKNEVVEKLVSGIDFLMIKNKINVIKATASFINNNSISLTGEKNYIVNAKDIIIATGSSISNINIPGINLPFVLNSTTALSNTKLPKSITIIGGGVIGMEFAFIYKNLGVEVNVVEFMDRLLTMVDKDVSIEIQRIAIESGINIYTSSRVKKIQRANNEQAIVTFEKDGIEELLISENVLSAIGRQPNLENLDIENTNIVLNSNGKGISVDENMKTNIPHIYAIGDVTNIMQLAHVASHQAITAVSNIIGEDKPINYLAVPNVIFTAPEISSVGLNEDDCINKKIDYKVSKFDYLGNGKALTMNETNGFIKLIKDTKTNKIIGGTIIGAEASSLIATITLAISNELTDEDIHETIFAHPTTSEIIHEAALGLGIGALHQ